MNAIKRSESPAKGKGQRVGPQLGGTGPASTIGNELTDSDRLAPTATQQQQQQQATPSGRLVFGLNARANKVRHDKYAEQRLGKKVPSSSKTDLDVNPTSGVKSFGHSNYSSATNRHRTITSSTFVPQDEADERARINGSGGGGVSIKNDEQKTTSVQSSTGSGGKSESSTRASRQQTAIRASKYGNFYKPQDFDVNPMTPTGSADSGSDKKQAQQASPAVVDDSDISRQGRSARARSKSPKRPHRSSAATRAGGGGPSAAGDSTRRKSLEGELEVSNKSTLEIQHSNNSTQQQQQQQPPIIKARTQFNILPPPQMAMATTGRGSVVSYAKSRIYDKPARPILSNPPELFNGDHPSSLVFSVGGEIPQSILSGRKPPKQVLVTKARKEWEGGEPFAKCRSRKRLAAVQRKKNKLLIHESWSMTSVVATQQLQLQQALAASNAMHRSNIQQSDPSVKVLTRGSVLERVQQFERVPSSSSIDSSLSGSSISSSSSSSSLDSSSTLDDAPSEDELELNIESNNSTTTSSNESNLLSPNAGKQAAYRYKVSRIQKQQQQSTTSPTATLTTTTNGSNKPSSVGSNHGDAQRRLSFSRQRRLSSIGLNKIHQLSSSSLIPKFYHPKGTKPNTYEIELEKRNILTCFDKFPDRKAQLVGPMARRHFHSIASACGFSEYYKIPLLLYIKHLIDTRPDLMAEANLMACNGHGPGSAMARRRSSLAPLNPNNVPNGISAPNQKTKIHHQLARSNSQQIQTSTIISTKDNNNLSDKAKKSETTKIPLQKSASIDSSKNINQQGQDDDKIKIVIQYVTCEQFLACWKQLISTAYDTAARFTHLLTLGRRDYLLPDDFVPMVQSIIDDHPGLKFLRAAPDFHMRYIQTVIARIYYCVNKSWTGKIKLQELRRSNLLAVLQVLAQEEDINQITDYFSYEHFYVIYCKFWTLDQDHDLLISKEDLARHNDASISSRIIERVFSGIVSRQIAQSGKMSYSDFVWFIIAEEDKKHPRSVEYWFRLMDLDGDGFISMYELEYFYYEQMKRLELMNIEALPFLDTACQILDLVNPKEKNKISLADLKRTKLATIFFDTFINLEKYLEHESREFVSARDVVQDGVVISDWDRYASEEYENMVTEETTV